MRVSLDDEPSSEVAGARDIEDVGFALRSLTLSGVLKGQRITAKGSGKHPQGQANEILLHRGDTLLRRTERWRASTAPALRRRRPAAFRIRRRRSPGST